MAKKYVVVTWTHKFGPGIVLMKPHGKKEGLAEHLKLNGWLASESLEDEFIARDSESGCRAKIIELRTIP